jgi:uncharacterized protein YecE (DUF72 family)
MTAKEIGGLLSAGLCLAVVLVAGLGTAEHGYYIPYSASAPETAQERADLLKAIQKLDVKPQAASGEADLYLALQNPYAFKDPQAALEMADAYKAIQKLNSINYGPHSGDGWHYWANMWLKEPEKEDVLQVANAYEAMDNPYAYRDPQAALEMADTYKAIQKMNSIQYGLHGQDSWYYWTNIWLGPTSG